MKKATKRKAAVIVLLLAVIMLTGCGNTGGNSDGDTSKNGAGNNHVATLTNVSYDPTREFYGAYNELFKQYYKNETGMDVMVIQSHGGSGGQARSVVEGG